MDIPLWNWRKILLLLLLAHQKRGKKYSRSSRNNVAPPNPSIYILQHTTHTLRGIQAAIASLDGFFFYYYTCCHQARKMCISIHTCFYYICLGTVEVHIYSIYIVSPIDVRVENFLRLCVGALCASEADNGFLKKKMGAQGALQRVHARRNTTISSVQLYPTQCVLEV